MKKTDELAEVFSQIEDADTMKRFFEEIFTPHERKDFALRWQSLKMVNEGMPQRKISEELGISLCKITRAAKVLKKEGSVSKKLLDDQTY